MTRTFFSRRAIGILVLVFFLVPFALRGARNSVQGMKNDVRNWLPSTFAETAEMEWFWKHFLGERFVIASWPGCEQGSEAYELMLKKLQVERPPSMRHPADNSSKPLDMKPADELTVSHEKAMHSIVLERDYDFVGDRLELYCTGNVHRNWGGRDEKWLRGKGDLWYFLTPQGELYSWDGAKAPLASALVQFWRRVSGSQIRGDHVASFTQEDAAWYYENPRRLNAQYFKTVTTGPSVLQGLIDDSRGVLRDNVPEAEKRLRGSLFGPDGKLTCFVLTLTDAGRADMHRVIGRGVLGKPVGRLYELAMECGLKTEEFHLGGPPVDNVAIDEEGTITLVRLVSLCVLLGVGLAYACFRTISATTMVFVVGGIAAVASLAIVGWFGSELDAVLMSMPALVYVLGISGAAHLINYYREAVEEHGFDGAPESAVKHGWKPALLCNITTALGLFSLFTSDIVPIRKFGVFSGVAVMATLVLLFTYLPAALQIWPQKPRTANERLRAENPWYDRYLVHFWDRLASFIVRHHVGVSMACIAICVGVGWGITRINTTVNMLKMFDGKAKILADYAWLETNIGKLVPMEVVIKVPKEKLQPHLAARTANGNNENDPLKLNFLERMQIVDTAQRIIEEQFGEAGRGVAGRSLSAVTFAPILPQPKPGMNIERYAKQGSLEKYRDDFLKSEYLRIDRQDGSELWRISLRIAALQDVDYGDFVKELKTAIEPVIAAQAYRDQVLQKVLERREDGKLTRASICILGAALGSRKSKTLEGNSAEVADHSLTIDGPQILAQSLRETLKGKLRVEWHDPGDGPLNERSMENLAKFDCIILAGDTSLYDLDAIQKRARSIVDARDAVASTDISVVAQGDSRDRSGKTISAVYTGVVPIVYKAQRTLLESLIQSTFWSFVTITPLMMFVSRSVGAGLVAMLPNVLPVFVIFGGMGWMNIQVDIGSMMTASIALGVAVDDTIHYLSWYRLEIDKGLSRPAAILNTYKRCATPTFQAALISGLGLSIFAFSTFTPTQRFGYLMLTILFMGVVAELIFFPALLAGPLGRVFRPRKAPVEATVESGCSETVVYSLEEERNDRPHQGVGQPRLGTPRMGERGTGTRDR